MSLHENICAAEWVKFNTGSGDMHIMQTNAYINQLRAEASNLVIDALHIGEGYVSSILTLLHSLVLKVDVSVEGRGLDRAHYVPDVYIALSQDRAAKEGAVHRAEPGVLAVKFLRAARVAVRGTEIEVLHMYRPCEGDHLLCGDLGDIVNADVIADVHLMTEVVTLHAR